MICDWLEPFVVVVYQKEPFSDAHIASFLYFTSHLYSKFEYLAAHCCPEATNQNLVGGGDFMTDVLSGTPPPTPTLNKNSYQRVNPCLQNKFRTGDKSDY